MRLAFRPLFAASDFAFGEFRHEPGCRAVESDDVQHARVLGIRDGEAGRGHSHDDQLSADAGGLPVLIQRLDGLDVAGPGLVVRKDDERIDLDLVLERPRHGKRGIGASAIIDGDLSGRIQYAVLSRDPEISDPMVEAHDGSPGLRPRRDDRKGRRSRGGGKSGTPAISPPCIEPETSSARRCLVPAGSTAPKESSNASSRASTTLFDTFQEAADLTPLPEE